MNRYLRHVERGLAALVLAATLAACATQSGNVVLLPEKDGRDAAVTVRQGERTLVLGWGSTYGPINAACQITRRAGSPVAQAHLRHLNPFPANTAEVLRRYDKVVIPEMNLGQLALLIRGRFLVDAIPYNQVRGLPFRAEELAGVIKDVVASV